MAILGIDLGTTNSLGALYLDNKVCLVPNEYGEFLTPSVVSIDHDGSVYVGAVAKERLITHPDMTVASFKRNMGKGKIYNIGGKRYSSEEFSSFVIRRIVDDAERYVKDMEGVSIDEVVISVPAYFQDKQRVATKQAGLLAGVKVHRIVNEPSAAALAVHHEKKGDELVLVFDFGGGTLDVSVVDCFDNVVEIISVAGNNRLGGDDFNAVIAEVFLKDNNLFREHMTDKEYAILLKNSEKCKRQISKDHLGIVSLVMKEKTLTTEVTDKRLMEESKWIFNKIKLVLERALRDADITINDIGTVVMAGGSSNMPLVQVFLRLLFPNTNIVYGSGEELIARGVGLIAGIIERNTDIKEVIMTDICPFTLGVNVLNEGDPKKPYMHTIIARNNSLPCSKTERLYTAYDNQKVMSIKVLQGENPYADENVLLGEVDIDVKPKPKGEESVDVTYTYDINGVLVVDVVKNSTGEKETRVISQTVQGAELENEIAKLTKIKLKAIDDEKNDLTRERILSIFEQINFYNRGWIQHLLEQYDYVLGRRNNREIRHFRKYVNAMIDAFEESVDNYDVFRPENVDSFSYDDYEEGDGDNDED